MQAANAPPSRAHSNVAALEGEVKENVALWLVTAPVGPSVIVVSGPPPPPPPPATVQDQVWDGPTVPQRSTARTSKTCWPSATPL